MFYKQVHKQIFKQRTLAALTAGLLALGSANAALAEAISFVGWGGGTQEAQNDTWAKPFSEQTGVKALMDGPTDYGKLKAMVDSGNVAWDVVDVEGDFALRAAAEGLLEPIDFSVVPRDKLAPHFVSEHGIGAFYYSFVLGYNQSRLPAAKAPQDWAALFDTAQYPGKRAFYRWPSPGALELALLADGVTPDKLYPLDLDRAFKKLDTIKGSIVWWSGGAQSQQLLASGEASLGMFWNGRVSALQKDGAPVGASWKQNLVMYDMLVIPRGTKNKDVAMKFLTVATSAKPQAEFAGRTDYGPINLDSPALLDKEQAANSPSSHAAEQVKLDMAYWAKNGPAIATRWNEWLVK